MNQPPKTDLASELNISHQIIERAISLVERETGIARAVFLSKCREEELFWARSIVYHLARHRGVTLCAIAAIASRDHTGVMHALNRVQERMSIDHRFDEALKLLEREMV
jgi:chromosomal replication initiation ATPase DnaA